MSERQRLGVQDALWLDMDKPGNLMVVDSLFWTSEPLDWDAYLDVTRRRLWDRYPVFRSVAVRDHGVWSWEERPDASYDDRFERVTLPAPGGDAELQQLISSQRTVPLDRDQPLWRAILVDGFHGGSAVLFRAHHAIADGIRMVQLTLSVFDTTPDALPSRRPGGRPAPVAPPAAAPPVSPVSQALRWVTGLAQATTRLARGSLTNPLGSAHTALAASESLVASSGVPGDVDTLRKFVLGTRNDSTLWSGTVGEDKAIAWSPAIPLEDVKATARATGTTVNDVLVACVADSLRSYLERHDAVCHSVTWDVPVNLQPFDPSLPVELGNGFALVQLELPTNLDDPLRTLDVVRRRMGRIKRSHEAVVDFGIQAAISRMSKRLYRASIDLLANRAVGVLTNVRGPDLPLYAAGRRIEGMMGWAPLTADQVMSVTIYSYDGRVFVGIAADAGLVPDHGQIVDGFADAFRRLSALTLAGARGA